MDEITTQVAQVEEQLRNDTEAEVEVFVAGVAEVLEERGYRVEHDETEPYVWLIKSPRKSVEITFNFEYFLETDDNVPLYYRYACQADCQDAYVELDVESEELTADYDGEIGNAVPSSVWHNRVLRFPCSPYLSVSDLEDLLDKVLPLAQIVCDNAEIEWDGSNHVGVFNAKADSAMEKIRVLCEETKTEVHNVYNALDWIAADGNLEAQAYDFLAENEWLVSKALKSAVDQANSDGVRLCELGALEKEFDELLETKGKIETEARELAHEYIEKYGRDPDFDGLDQEAFDESSCPDFPHGFDIFQKAFAETVLLVSVGRKVGRVVKRHENGERIWAQLEVVFLDGEDQLLVDNLPSANVDYVKRRIAEVLTAEIMKHDDEFRMRVEIAKIEYHDGRVKITRYADISEYTRTKKAANIVLWRNRLTDYLGIYHQIVVFLSECEREGFALI